MKKITILLFFILLFSNCKPEKKDEIKTEVSNEKPSTEEPFILTVEKIDSTQFPSSIKYEGFIKNAVRWKDKLGDNIVITTETDIHFNDKFKHELDGRDAELFAYHFIISDNNVKQTWKVYDYISDCPVDIVASFVKNTFQVTDLDKNGIAETWLMYKTVCHGDVSPSDMKIIMYEGNTKYAMRGENKVAVGIDDNGKKQFEGGEYKLDENFKKGPKVFKEFAQKLWNDNLIETWED
ncbi:M949_RS01915 family surface polysaccharide biosynthesis protein [Flavobacterium sharifuzzamanii]|uniref:M949_RS01915 family surface polysaccharide biosynthesis protein n=1 Tax=Flavobacterium sharifuzzamanii TaxID=2211133 RepID=UPI000DABEE73|nr:hypothetical protein [Flavobacterium sharifuzzamanii]KAF2081993.1 hypothetical protein DMA14_05855 [Flavobacterium sharifuzzamanii]